MASLKKQKLNTSNKPLMFIPYNNENYNSSKAGAVQKLKDNFMEYQDIYLKSFLPMNHLIKDFDSFVKIVNHGCQNVNDGIAHYNKFSKMYEGQSVDVIKFLSNIYAKICPILFDHTKDHHIKHFKQSIHGEVLQFSYYINEKNIYGKVKTTSYYVSHFILVANTGLLPIDDLHTSHICNYYVCINHLKREEQIINNNHLLCQGPTFINYNGNLILLFICNCKNNICLRPANEINRNINWDNFEKSDLENKLKQYEYIVFQFKRELDEEFTEVYFDRFIKDCKELEFTTDGEDKGRFWKLTIFNVILQQFPMFQVGFEGIVPVKDLILKYNFDYTFKNDPDEMKYIHPEYYIERSIDNVKDLLLDKRFKSQLSNGLNQTITKDGFINCTYNK